MIMRLLQKKRSKSVLISLLVFITILVLFAAYVFSLALRSSNSNTMVLSSQARAVQVSAGANFSLAVFDDGSLWAWGNNGLEVIIDGFPAEGFGLGRIGDGTTEHRPYPVQILTDVISVSVSSRHTLAVTSDGALWAWGDNDHGQLGDGTTVSWFTPVKINPRNEN